MSKYTYWPYRLRKLINEWEAGGGDAAEIPIALNVSPERFRQYVSGARIPDPRTALDLDKMLSGFSRRRLRHERIPPRVVTENESRAVVTEEAPPARDVYEDVATPEGYRSWTVVASDGLLGIQLLVHNRFLGQRDIPAGLRRWLHESDPILRVVHGDQSTS